MVGVAGRSKGCLTCKARKKGCDQQRPNCGQCRRSNLVCQGYQDSLTFVVYQQSQGKSQGLHSTGGMIIRPKSRSTSPTLISTSSLNSSAFEDQLFYKYWDHYYPQTAKSSFKHDHSQTQLGSWQMAIKDQCLDERIVRGALLAMANGSMHRSSEDGRFKYAAMEAYSRVLKELNLALQGENKAISDNVLATCKLLATFEVSGGASDPCYANYERHIEGINRIMMLRGPSSHSSYLAHTLFLDARYQSVWHEILYHAGSEAEIHQMIIAMRKREPCPFARPEWLTMPWMYRPKDVKDELIDLMVQVPGLISEFDDIKQAKSTVQDSPESRRRFFWRAKLFQEDVDRWNKRLKESTSPYLLEETEDGIPETFDINQMFLAHTRVLYWTMLLRFYDLITIACNDIPVSDSAITLEDTMFDFNPVQYAFKIAKSINYFFQEGGGVVLAQSVSFCLGTATLYFSKGNLRDSVEARTIWDGLKRGKTGKMVSQFLVSARNHDRASKGEPIGYNES